MVRTSSSVTWPQCPYCDYAESPKLGGLNIHISKEHPGEKKVKLKKDAACTCGYVNLTRRFKVGCPVHTRL